MGSVQEKKIRIAIVGGGIGGLSLAIGLQDVPHLDVTVYEATKEYREVGQGLAMHANAIAAMQNIDPQVFEAWRDSSTLEGSVEDSDTISVTTISIAWGPNVGAQVAELGQAKARKTVSRADLLFELLNVLKQRGGKVQMGKRLREIQASGETVDLTFEDGSKVTTDCLIGAEGAHSKTREFLLGADHPATGIKNPLRYVSLRSLVPMEKAKAVMDEHWTRNASIRIGPEGCLVTMPVKRGSTLQIGATFMASEEDDIRTAPFPFHAFSDYDAEYQRLLQLVKDGHQERLQFWDHDPAPAYFRNRVCMMGDAAHCTTPFAGNGAAQALEDVAVLKTLLQKVKSADQIPGMFEAYDQIRRPRSQKVVEISRQFGRVHMMLDPPDRNNIDDIRRIYSDGASFTNGIDVEAQNQEAVRALEAILARGVSPSQV